MNVKAQNETMEKRDDKGMLVETHLVSLDNTNM